MSGAVKISEPGEYDVMIIDPFWEQAPEKAGDKARMCLVIPCHTDDGKFFNFRAYFTNAIAQKGRNAGRSQASINADLCIQLGMAEPFDPSRISELNDKLAVLVMENEEYQGKTKIAAKYLNPPGNKKLSGDEANAIWSLLSGKPKTAPIAAPAGSTAKDDQLPFG